MRTRTILLTSFIAIALLGAACTSNSEDVPESVGSSATTTAVAREVPDLEFGSGEVPFTVPALFPVPEAAVIGSTMIDGVNGRTEMIVTFPASVDNVVDYYETNLPVLGFTVTSSKGTEAEWDISMEVDGVKGTINLKFAGDSLSTGTILFSDA